MPQQLEALKIAQVLRADQRRMALSITIAGAVTLILGFVIFPALMYRHGAALMEFEVVQKVGAGVG